MFWSRKRSHDSITVNISDTTICVYKSNRDEKIRVCGVYSLSFTFVSSGVDVYVADFTVTTRYTTPFDIEVR
jgi:hypothetical protein